FGDALLGEGGGAFSPELLDGGEDAGRVFFRTEGGGLSRRRARRLLSSMDHTTVSPREKSRACATAEGKLIYHCSLALRLMSWTLVGKPMALSSQSTRYHTKGAVATGNYKNVLYPVKSQSPGESRPRELAAFAFSNAASRRETRSGCRP